MNFHEYQIEVQKLVNHELSQRDQQLNFAIGLGEVGELQNAVKKHIFHGHNSEEARKKVLEEAGDTLWYLTALLKSYGCSLHEAAENNIKKLKKRYPHGFSKEASRNRKE